MSRNFGVSTHTKFTGPGGELPPESLLARLTAYPIRGHLRTRAHRLRLRSRDLVLRPPKAATQEDIISQREDLARRYIRGSGLEIGALHAPLRVPPPAEVAYVDLVPLEGLRERYSILTDRPFVVPSVIDDCARLDSVADESADFVIANHVFEHIEDPIAALHTWLRVVRPGGVIFLAVPDKRRTFDCDRPSTSIEHLERDHAEGPEWSRSGHYREYAELAERVPAEDVDRRAAEMEAENFDIHFHVWDRGELLALLVHLAEAHEPRFDVEAVQANGPETLVVLRKALPDDG